MCQFPHEVTYLARTKLSYINLPRLLNDGKRNRAARIPGFVAIHLGDVCDLIFLRAGEPFHAARLSPAERRAVTIAEVLRKVAVEIERGENGSIGYYGAPEAQLGVMLATLLRPALPPDATLDLSHPDQLFPALQQQRFSGIVELSDSRGLHYLCFQEGGYGGGFFSGRRASVPLADFLESIFRAGGNDGQVRLFAPLSGLPEQASPSLLNLYRRLIQLVTREVTGPLGADGAVELLRRSQDSVRVAHPALAVFELRDGGWVLGNTVASPDELTVGVGAWLTDVLFSVADQTGADPADILARTARDDRFVLAERGLFSHLPWPVVF